MQTFLSVEAIWSSGSVTNANGATFTPYRMAGTSGFTADSAGADLYFGICNAAGLSTLGNGYNNQQYMGNCAQWGCLPTPSSGWGSTSNVDDQVRINTGWGDYDVLIHTYETGYPYGYDNEQSTAELAGNTYYPVCITEN